MNDREVLQLLETLLKTSVTGEHYSETEYHKERYRTIRSLAGQLYQNIYQIDSRPLQNVDSSGYITPKVGVNAIITNDKGELLLEQRMDDNLWGLPGGWAEVGLTAEENIIKEVNEETGLNITVVKILSVFSRMPSERSVHTSYHIVFLCRVVDGTLRKSHESRSIEWRNVNDIHEWHYDHKEWIDRVLPLHDQH